jgi:hypothetical protein
MGLGWQDIADKLLGHGVAVSFFFIQYNHRMFQKPIEIHISFDDKSVVVQSGDLIEKFSNQIAIEKEGYKIVEMGKTEDELSASNPGTWNQYKQGIVFEPIYDPKNFNPDTMFWALTSFARDVEYRLRGFRLYSNAICYTRIPGYESFPKEAQAYLEYTVQNTMRFRQFLINGKGTVLESRTLNFANGSLGWGRWISFILLLFLIVRNSDSWTSNLEILSNNLWFVFPVMLIASFFVVIWVIDMVWLVGMQYILPKKFIRWIFQGQNGGGWSISNFLPDLVLGKEN